MRIGTVVTAAALLLGAAQPQAALAAKPQAATCGDYGTSIYFEDSPQEAAKKALKEEKLVLVLHVSGHFEDPALT
jgi:hypothetical protein